MSKRKKRSNAFWLNLISFFLLMLSITGLLGAFGFAIGKQVNSLFAQMMGSFSWAGPLLCFVLAILLWIYSESRISKESRGSNTSATGSSRVPKNRTIQNTDQQSDQDHRVKGISLPIGKLVSLQGFNQYFSTPEWVEMKDLNAQKAEEMKEVGRDFPSYFGTGESLFPKNPPKMKSLKGLDDYIEGVDLEERQEGSEFFVQQDNVSTKSLSDVSTVKPSVYSSVFKSRREQEEFLSRYKTDEHTPKEEVSNNKTEEHTPKQESPDKEEILEVHPLVNEVEKMSESQSAACLEINESLHESSRELPLVSNDKHKQTEVENTIKSTDARQVALEDQVDQVDQIDQIDQIVELAINDKVEGAKVIRDKNDLDRINHWKFPEFNLLDPMIQREIIQDPDTSKQLEKVLLDFGVKAKIIRVTRGPVITRYELVPLPGVKISKIVNLSDDIALALAAPDVRIEAPIPGKAAIGIEVPNKQARAVPFREVLETASFGQYSSKLKVALGKDIADQPIIADLIKMPHLLVAGATGAGKSVCITSIINSILYNATPDEVKFLLVDPKMVELSQYNGIPHLLAPVVIDPKKAASALKWIVKEMENRYELFAASGVRDIERYNHLKGEPSKNSPTLPLIVVIIDELADLMMVAPGEVEEAICRLAQMARAAGIHLVIATQRPSVDVITGVIKANIPSRISFAVSSQIDSRTILDASGAEKLLGRGDMLYSPLGVNKALRVQGCLVTDDEVQRVIKHWKALGKPEYLDPERLFEETTTKNEESHSPDDAVFIDAGQLFIRTGMASVSFLQRRLKVGYTRAARLMDMLEDQGVVGAYEGSKPRQVLLTLEEFNERFG